MTAREDPVFRGKGKKSSLIESLLRARNFKDVIVVALYATQ